MSDRFDGSILVPDPVGRGRILDWLDVGLAAVDPEPLTRRALVSRAGERAIVIAIGKAAAAMARGAADVLDVVGGVCVSDHVEETTSRIPFLVGDHPVPGPGSLSAGVAVLESVRSAPSGTPIIALVSGGGSTVCEMPREGVTLEYLAGVNRRLIMAGATIEEINLVRAHLSAIKGGGLSRAAGRPIDTFVVSDVGAADPGVVASGPTIPGAQNPEAAITIMTKAGIEVPPEVRRAMSAPSTWLPRPIVTLIADGFDAARAIAGVAPPPVVVRSGWLEGDLESCLDSFISTAEPGVTIGVGETVLEVGGDGRGGRSTHAALLAAIRLEGTTSVFTAFATDGVDGSSRSAGAIADGGTISRGGDPGRARAGFDSAGYLEATSDLLKCAATGTNVSDIWILWRPEDGPDRRVA